MIESIVKKIMLTGITKYAKKYGVSPEKVQIKVSDNPDGFVNYEMAKNYIAEEQVSFLQIMDKRFDIMNYEGLASPFLKQSIENVAREKNKDVSSVTCYILCFNQGGKLNVGLAFYDGVQNLKNVSLSKHLQSLGI